MDGEMVIKYTETGNVLESIRRFQRQFPNRTVYYCWRFCSNLNHTDILIVIMHYCLSARGLWFGNCFWNLLIVSRTLPVSVYFKTINTRSSTEKCDLGCVPTISRAVLLFSAPSVQVLGFAYLIKAMEQLRNTWLCNVIIPLFKW